MVSYSQNNTIDRQPVAAGRFYPGEKPALTKEMSSLFKNCNKTSSITGVRAIISPHAGYIYSGKTAAAAYSVISDNQVFKNIFVIGSSHVMSFDGASVYNLGDYITPIGKVVVNREIANQLIDENKVFDFPVNAHLQEHSIEVQLPFIQHYFNNQPSIVPVIIGTGKEGTLKKIAEVLRPWFTPENLFVISSDFSHYPPYNEAVECDKATAMGIVSGDPQTFLSVIKKNSEKRIPGLATSMCGWSSALVLLYLAEGNDQLEIKLIDYCNSGDSPHGNKDEVVGYHAIAMMDKHPTTPDNMNEASIFSFTGEEKKLLFDIARKSISLKLNEGKSYNIDEDTIPGRLMGHFGAFVTLKINGVLRGCIGRFVSDDPLYKVIGASAISSAFEDPRFTPLTKDEFKKTDIEITVLGPLIKIENPDEIVLGKHGVYIKKDMRSGTLLPQVATENGWNVEQFLGYTSRDKAGIGWDGWKDAEIFIYEGAVLEENSK
jgi:AmmeMemoRadiSam system protein B/AmmeMemoRadiSam system protein A